MRVKLQQLIVLIGDVIILYFSLIATLIIRYGNLTNPLSQSHFIPFSIVFLFWIMIFYLVGLYDILTLRNSKNFNTRFTLGLVLNFLLITLFFYFVPLYEITPRANLFLFLLIFGVTAYAWRSFYNHRLQSQIPPKRVLILGDTKSVHDIIQRINEHPQFGYEIIYHSIHTQEYGNVDSLVRIVQEQNIQIIIVPHSIKIDSEMYPALKQKFFHARFIDLKTIYEELFGKIPLEELDLHWFDEGMSNNNNIYEILMRFFDVVFATFLFITLLPVSILIILLIKITSPGSAFFTQIRTGLYGKKFTLWKFRTMIPNAEQNGPTWSHPGDKRITPLGKILRKTHLDELPQLWNIVCGDLSFIGPRPERPEFTVQLEAKIPYYNLRYNILPGLTGWAQINYPYGSSFEDAYQKLEYDLYYIKYRSLFLNFSILIKTIRHLFVSA